MVWDDPHFGKDTLILSHAIIKNITYSIVGLYKICKSPLTSILEFINIDILISNVKDFPYNSQFFK